MQEGHLFSCVVTSNATARSLSKMYFIHLFLNSITEKSVCEFVYFKRNYPVEKVIYPEQDLAYSFGFTPCGYSAKGKVCCSSEVHSALQIVQVIWSSE